jgi:hypothetical protein
LSPAGKDKKQTGKRREIAEICKTAPPKDTAEEANAEGDSKKARLHGEYTQESCL